MKQFQKQLILLRDFLTNPPPPCTLFEIMNLATEALSQAISHIRILFYMVSISSNIHPLRLVPCPVRQLTPNSFAYDPASQHNYFTFKTNHPHGISIGLPPDYVFGFMFIEKTDAHPLSEVEKCLASITAAHTAIQLTYLWCKDATGTAGEETHSFTSLVLDEVGSRVWVKDTTGTAGEETHSFTSLVLDEVGSRVWVKDIPLQLSRSEFAVFRVLYRHLGDICRRDLICRETYNNELLDPYERHDRLDVLIFRLRTKLNSIPNNEIYIETIRRVGYQLKYELQS